VAGYPGGVTVKQIAPNHEFNVHHGPYPASSVTQPDYTCMICDGAQGNGAYPGGVNGWNSDAFGSHIHNLRLDMGGNSNIFGLYTLNEQELSEWDHIQCAGWNSSGAKNRACWFVDRTESSTNQSGPGSFVVDQIQLGANNVTTAPVGDYGGLYEGSRITIQFSGGSCTSPGPAAAVTSVVPATLPLTGAAINAVQVTYGHCPSGAPASVQATYPNGSGSLSACNYPSVTPTRYCWNNGLPQLGNATLAISGSNPITLTVTNGGSGYPFGFVGGMKSISNMTFTDASNGAPPTNGVINGGQLIDGSHTQSVNAIHCE
jgi:hypothetical protein